MSVAGSTSMTDIEYSKQAVSHLENLEPHIAERVMDKLDEATEWTSHHLDTLKNSEYYKLRIGDYRAIIDWDKENDTLLVIAVGHRKTVYDRYL